MTSELGAERDGELHLEAIQAEAEADCKLANRAAFSANAGAIELSELVALRKYQDGVALRRKDVTEDPTHERTLIGALCAAIAQNGDLTLATTEGSRLRIGDTGPAKRLTAARAALQEATEALEEWRCEHRVALEAAAAERRGSVDDRR
jgi:hypothetical protein